jgi:uncharacterized protein (TIGR01777 family)
MRIVIAGGTGFLGTPLAAALQANGHEVTVLTRRTSAAPEPMRVVPWVPDGSIGPWAHAVEGADAVVNLAGESIAGARWTDAHKRRIRESRGLATRSIAGAIRAATAPPSVVVSGSAVGYYGPRGDEPVTELTPAGADFLAQVCVEWEREAQAASTPRTRVVCIRTGLVLERDGGALPQMLPPFRFGVGGPVGSGRQYWPWIHRTDWIALVRWAILSPTVAGAVNATAPEPVTNAEFARTLGSVLRRPALLPAPAFALRAILGEMAGALLLSGQRAVPEVAERNGFAFSYRRLEPALRAIFNAP